MRQTHRWEELLPEQFTAEMERAPIVYWACGAMEEHGLQNAMGVDPFTAYEICRRAVEQTGGILFPPVPFAPAYIPGLTHAELRARTKPLFPPSLWISRGLCRRLYLELLESLADLGFRVCLATGGHYPAELLLRGLEQDYQGRIGEMRFWGGGTVRLLEDAVRTLADEEPLALGHGTMWETSMTMAVNPDWVDLSRVEHILEGPLPSQLKANSPECIAYIHRANPELGERMLTLAANNLAEIARALLPERRESK